MMNINHSPGPWAVTDGHYPCFREVRGASFRISVVMSASDLTEDDYGRRSADLKLIAAAPLLLDALQQCLSVLHNIDINDSSWAGDGSAGDGVLHQHEAIDAARAAIAAATN